MVIFIKNEGLVELRIFFMVIFQNGFSPKAASRQSRIFGYPENPEFLEVWKSKFEQLLISNYELINNQCLIKYQF